MIALGLTGGIGMGKSVAAGFLRDLQVPVIDTDELARRLVEPGQPALHEIATTFGPKVIDPSGHLRRDEMAALVFADAEKRHQLEAILHPRIRDVWTRELEMYRSQGAKAAVVVIPLLFETSAESLFQYTLCTACSITTQHVRLAARGWTREHADRRAAAQWPVGRKMARADFVIWTETPLDTHREQVGRIWGSIQRRH